MGRMNIVVTDGVTLNPGDNPWDELEGLGALTVYDRTAPGELIDRCRDAHILIVNKTQIREPSLEQLPSLRYITLTATGYDVVDVAAAGRRGIPVSNIPIYGTDSVAQYVFSAVLHLCHNINAHDAAVKTGEWTSSPDWSFWKMPLVELAGKTLGVVGFGRIGRRVGELAHAFGMSVLAYDAFRGRTRGMPLSPGAPWRNFSLNQIVSLRLPLTGDRRRFVNQQLLGRLRSSAILVNASRGRLVNEEDLAAALNAGKLAAAAVDVWCPLEPIRRKTRCSPPATWWSRRTWPGPRSRHGNS